MVGHYIDIVAVKVRFLPRAPDLMDVKETYLMMKGWERLHGQVCVGCSNDKKIAAYVLNSNYLNMDVAPHWVMCIHHAFKAQVGFDKGVWRQSRYYDGSTW